MSTNNENTPVQDHYRSDALIATGATLSVFILGGILQFLSPNTQKMASDTEVSQPMTVSEETAPSADLASDSSEMTASSEMTTSEATPPASEIVTSEMTASEATPPVSEITEEMPGQSEDTSFTSETPTATETVASTETESVSMMETAASMITDPGTINQLNGQVYTTIDQGWTTNPTFTANLVYQIKVTESGAIASYDAINQPGKDYNNEVPLESLVQSDASSDNVAQFLVVFTPGGQLEVSPWIAAN